MGQWSNEAQRIKEKYEEKQEALLDEAKRVAKGVSIFDIMRLKGMKASKRDEALRLALAAAIDDLVEGFAPATPEEERLKITKMAGQVIMSMLVMEPDFLLEYAKGAGVAFNQDDPVEFLGSVPIQVALLNLHQTWEGRDELVGMLYPEEGGEDANHGQPSA